MPALQNPRWEKFCQALVASLSDKAQGKNTQTAAYLSAGYSASPESARRCASRLLTYVDAVADRVKELQAQQLARIQPKLDLSKERIGRNLDYATQLAKQQGNVAGIVSSELGIAKVFHSIATDDAQQTSFKSARSMHDIGKRLLQSFGVREPDDVSIQLAIEANDAFIDRLKAISDAAQGLR
jgi:response regulator RpfG family c-di-GMP phosphodiesterase